MPDNKELPFWKRKYVCPKFRSALNKLQLAKRISDKERARQVFGKESAVESVRRMMIASDITSKNYKSHLDWLLKDEGDFPDLFTRQEVGGYKGGYIRWLQQGGKHKGRVFAKELRRQKELEKDEHQNKFSFGKDTTAELVQKEKREEDIMEKDKQKGIAEGSFQELREAIWSLAGENIATFRVKTARKGIKFSETWLAEVIRDGKKLYLPMHKISVNIVCVYQDCFPRDFLVARRKEYKDRVKKEGKEEDPNFWLLEFETSAKGQSQGMLSKGAVVCVSAGKTVKFTGVAKRKIKIRVKTLKE